MEPFELTEKVAFTPDLRNFGTCSNVNLKFCKRQNVYYVVGDFVTGTVLANKGYISFPAGIEIGKGHEKFVLGHLFLDSKGIFELGLGPDSKSFVTEGDLHQYLKSCEKVQIFTEIPIEEQKEAVCRRCGGEEKHVRTHFIGPTNKEFKEYQCPKCVKVMW